MRTKTITSAVLVGLTRQERKLIERTAKKFQLSMSEIMRPGAVARAKDMLRSIDIEPDAEK